MQMSRCRPVLWALGVVLAAAAAGAEPGADRVEFRSRREALARQAGEGVVVVLGAEKNASYGPFRQSNRFYYLTGLVEPGAALVLLPKENRHVLFLSPTEPYLVRWEGPGLRPCREVEQAYLFDESRLYADLPSFLNECIAGEETVVWIPFEPEEVGRVITDAMKPLLRRRQADMLDQRCSREAVFCERLQQLFPTARPKDLSPLLRAMRVRKSASEAAAMRRAAAVSAAGWDAVLRSVRPGLYEYQLGAMLGYHARMAGGSDWPYWPIVGSGPNANVMHYVRNDRRLAEGDVVLMDAAFGWGYYAMDITRTFPVSGRFTPGQRKIYQDLLDVQKALVARVKPGETLAGLHEASEKMLAGKGYEGRTVHFLGHFIGMAVHDPGDVHAPLEPGMAITIEPGLYFPEKGMGFRIEDTVLVTAKGCEVLSAAVPKEVEEMEALWQLGKKERERKAARGPGGEPAPAEGKDGEDEGGTKQKGQ